MKTTGIVRDDRYMDHVMDPGHPESPERLRAIYRMLEEKEMKGRFEPIRPREATRTELLAIHSPEYVDLVASTAGKPHCRLDMDTSTSAQTYEAALLAAGGMMELIKALQEGKVRNGFALVRPPGHHAERQKAMGFCFFNNVAIGATYAIQEFGLERILIVDWDVHHGNGTQNSFYEDRRVLYFSTHRYGFFYPGTGAATEVGRGKGEGFTVNVPISSRADDAVFANYFNSILRPIALEYKPQMVLVSAGFDIHYDDPLGGMEVTPEGFARLTEIVMEIAEATAEGKLVLTLEGGYSVSGESESVKAVLNELSRVSGSPGGHPDLLEKEREDFPGMEKSILQIRDIHKRYWKMAG
jgi:acetoin utilization deacetylase AcuC-like enzyme